MTQKDEALKMEFEKIATKYKLNLEPSSIEEDCYASSTTNNYWWFFKDIKAALSEPEQVSLPDGWIAIPVEAGYTQIDAIVKELRICRARILKTAARCVYDTVIASAPTLNEKG